MNQGFEGLKIIYNNYVIFLISIYFHIKKIYNESDSLYAAVSCAMEGESRYGLSCR